MAIYHFAAQVIKRSAGKSAVASAAYRASEKLKDERTGLLHDYTRRRDEIDKNIIAPDYAPSWVYNRQQLWNEVEKSEKRVDSQLAREINIALPIELNKQQQKELINNFVKDNFVDKGMIADVAIHYKKDNPHAHVMLTTREISEAGFGKKNREWNDKELLEKWRESWAEYTNRALEKANINERIDHRTLEAQGADRLPQIHLGVHARALEDKGIITERGEQLRNIHEANKTKIVELDKYREKRGLPKTKIEQQKEIEEVKNRIDKILTECRAKMAKLMEEKQRQIRENLVKPEEKAALERAEKILSDKPTMERIQERINETNNKLNSMYKEYSQNRQKLEKLQHEIKTVNTYDKIIGELQHELDDKQKGLFSKMSNKEEIKELNAEITRLTKRKNSIVKDNEEYNKKNQEAERLKNELPDMKQQIEELSQIRKELLQAGVSLNNIQNRETTYEYFQNYKPARHWTPDEAHAIRDFNMLFNEKYGRNATIEEIKGTAVELRDRTQSILKDIKFIENETNRLKEADKALTKQEEKKAELDLMNTTGSKLKRMFSNKEKNTFEYAKHQYAKLSEKVNECGVKDRADYNKQLEAHKINLERQDKLEKELKEIKPYYEVSMKANNAIERANSIERKEIENRLKKGKSQEALMDESIRNSRYFKARHADLYGYLHQRYELQPIEENKYKLELNGKSYEIDTKGNTWRDMDTDKKGNTLDFAMRIEGKKLNHALEDITGIRGKDQEREFEERTAQERSANSIFNEKSNKTKIKENVREEMEQER